VKTWKDQKATFLLRRLQDAGFVTSHYMDHQHPLSISSEFFSAAVPKEQLASVMDDDPGPGGPHERYKPAHYFSHMSMLARYQLLHDDDPVCYNGLSSNAVRLTR
jgi:hypothetical protein